MLGQRSLIHEACLMKIAEMCFEVIFRKGGIDAC